MPKSTTDAKIVTEPTNILPELMNETFVSLNECSSILLFFGGDWMERRDLRFERTRQKKFWELNF